MLEYLIDDSLVSGTDKIAVGVSGGADSMLLLWALIDKQKQAGFYMKVIHVNHNLRGEDSDNDSVFVEEFCKKKKIPYEILSVNVEKFKNENKFTLEQAARSMRYDAIFGVMKKDNLNKLFLAHHKNDQAETVLMHILRGSGISGACGMRESDKIFRPLLNLKRTEILSIVKESGIKFVEDASNSDNKYTRNFLRNLVLPEIEKVYPGVVDAVCAFSEKCLEVQRFIEKQVDTSLIQKTTDGVIISAIVFDKENFIIREYLKFAFNEIGIFSDIEDKHYKLLIELFGSEINTSIDLPHDTLARHTYEGIKIIKKSKTKIDKSSFEFVIGNLNFDGFGEIITEVVSAYDVIYGDGSLYVDYNKLPADSVWRTRKVGDQFAMLGTGNKSLSDYFTDEKVDFELRDKLPVLASKEKVLVIANRDISEYVKVDGTTDTIIKISFKCT